MSASWIGLVALGAGARKPTLVGLEGAQATLQPCPVACQRPAVARRRPAEGARLIPDVEQPPAGARTCDLVASRPERSTPNDFFSLVQERELGGVDGPRTYAPRTNRDASELARSHVGTSTVDEGGSWRSAQP